MGIHSQIYKMIWVLLLIAVHSVVGQRLSYGGGSGISGPTGGAVLDDTSGEVEDTQTLEESPDPRHRLPTSSDINLQPQGLPDIQSLALHRRVLDTSVNCAKTYMEVIITFSEPFDGLIYPYLKFEHCLLWHGPRHTEVRMTLAHGICGAESELIPVAHPGGIKTSLVDPMIEHHLMIQWDRDLVGEDDMNVIVRCERPSDYNTTVAWSITAKDKLAVEERAEHPGPQMYMDLQLGEGPGAPAYDPNIPVLVGDTLTMLLVLSDEVFWFDSNILNCIAVDGDDSRPQILWADRGTGAHAPNFGQMNVIDSGCSVKKNVFSDFYKERQTLNNGQLVTTHYAHFKAFRFPTSHKVSIQCNVQVCYEDCPEQPTCSESFHPRITAHRRKRREVQHSETKDNIMDKVQLIRTLEVLLPDEGSLQQVHVAAVPAAAKMETCYTTTSFLSTSLILAALVIILGAILAYTCTKLNAAKPSFYSPQK